MAYNPVTDFFGIWRNGGASVTKVMMPGLDTMIAALARAGVITLSVSATAPVVNQSITAWLQAAVPSYSAEGTFRLWDKVTTTYLAATPKLFLEFLEACANQSGVSWWTVTGAPPYSNTIGNNGDYLIRTDEPGGVYGPKVAGAWPTVALPGTTNTISSSQLDNTFGTGVGRMIYRGAATWDPLVYPGVDNLFIVSKAGIPAWFTLSAIMDIIFGNQQGSVLYRGAGNWTALPPATATWLLTTNGVGANPSWQPRAAEFAAGTVMLFRQTFAPLGWTKQTILDDYALRVTAGAVGASPATPFTTVFAQTAVGNTTLDITQIPAHNHSYSVSSSSGIQKTGGAGTAPFDTLSALNTGNAGGGLAHTHSVNLTVSYCDVIIATKN